MFRQRKAHADSAHNRAGGIAALPVAESIMPRILVVAAVLLAFAFTCAAEAKKQPLPGTKPAKHTKSNAKGTVGEYDYYVMALSWSPTFCSTHPDEDEQCGRKGYGFILHGLWPQYQNGGGPERCVSDEDDPDRKTVNAALAFMPSRRLIDHEWRAHGVCTGLGAEKYFDLADRAFASLTVPSALKAPPASLQMSGNELRAALKQVNPTLSDNMLNLHCSQGELVEVRVCVDRDARLRACGKGMRNACPAATPFTIPAVR